MWQWYLHWQSVSLVWYSYSACFYFKNTFPHWWLTHTLFISPRKYLNHISWSARLELDSVLEIYIYIYVKNYVFCKRTMVLISVLNIIFTNQVMQSLSIKTKILWCIEFYQGYLTSNNSQWVNSNRLKVLPDKRCDTWKGCFVLGYWFLGLWSCFVTAFF